jgi:hypothetical protein
MAEFAANYLRSPHTFFPLNPFTRCVVGMPSCNEVAHEAPQISAE